MDFGGELHVLNVFAMNPHIITTAIFVSTCLLQYALNAAPLTFSYTVQKPWELDIAATQRISVRIQVTFSDPDKDAERSASALLSGKSLSIDEHADAVKWLLSRSQFVLAERHALALVQKTRSNHIGALISLAFCRVSRGDYETACKTFELIDKSGGPTGLRAWYVYLKSTTLAAAESVEALATTFVESGEVNVNSMAMTAVLATCTELKNGRPLFRLLEKSADASALAQHEDNARTFAQLQLRYDAPE